MKKKIINKPTQKEVLVPITIDPTGFVAPSNFELWKRPKLPPCELMLMNAGGELVIERIHFALRCPNDYRNFPFWCDRLLPIIVYSLNAINPKKKINDVEKEHFESLKKYTD